MQKRLKGGKAAEKKHSMPQKLARAHSPPQTFPSQTLRSARGRSCQTFPETAATGITSPLPQHHSTRLDEPFNRQPNSDEHQEGWSLEPAQPLPASSAPLPSLLPPTHPPSPSPPPPQLSINKIDTRPQVVCEPLGEPRAPLSQISARTTAYAKSPEAGHSGPKREDKWVCICFCFDDRLSSPSGTDNLIVRTCVTRKHRGRDLVLSVRGEVDFWE